MSDAERLSGFLTLFLVIDPIGTAPLFVALTRGMGQAKRRAIGLKACAIAAGILTVFGLFGVGVLDPPGISLPAFRIAGGLRMFLVAIEMMFDLGTGRREGDAALGGPGAVRDRRAPRARHRRRGRRMKACAASINRSNGLGRPRHGPGHARGGRQ